MEPKRMNKPLAYGTLGAAYGLGTLRKYLDKNPDVKEAGKAIVKDGKKVLIQSSKKATKYIVNPANHA